MSLWDTEQAWVEAMEKVAEAETPEEQSAALVVYDDALRGAIEKRERLAGFIRHVDARVEFFKAEEERLRERRKALENGRVRLFDFIKQVMQHMGIKKAEGTTSTFTLVANSQPALIVENEAAVPLNFWIEPPPPAKVLDKKAIREAIEAGQHVEGCRIDRGHHVRMR